jgi:hypothetical protein
MSAVNTCESAGSAVGIVFKLRPEQPRYRGLIPRCGQEIYLSSKVFGQYLGPTYPSLEQSLTVLSFRVQPQFGCVNLYHQFLMYLRGVYTDKCSVLYFTL